VLGDRGDARALEPVLLEQLGGGIEHALPRLLGLLGSALRAVAAGFDFSGHGWHSTTLSNTVML
jgi:hypothetical protein